MKFEDMINTIQLGDCQDILPHILECVDRKKVILVSDPPFNVGYHYNTYKDNLSEEEYFEALESIFGEDFYRYIMENRFKINEIIDYINGGTNGE